MGDRQLARMASRGDVRAFAAIYERHHGDLYRYCRSICGNHEDASDALQSTMAAALGALPGERREISLRPWLFRVAHNESVSLVRRRRDEVQLTEEPESNAASPERAATLRERLGQLLSDLRVLPERQRGALLMRELSGLSYAEVASALGLSEGGARQAVYEARIALHDFQEGRDMRCDAARKSISACDGRLLRSFGPGGVLQRRDRAGLLQRRARPRGSGHPARPRPRCALLQPDALDFVRLFDGQGSVIPLGSDEAKENARFGIRRSSVAARLKAIYGSVDRVDAFVGMIAERHLPGSEFGALQYLAWKRQFQALRDGDRFFYANDPLLGAIEHRFGISFRHRLSDLIALNTDVPRDDLPRKCSSLPSLRGPAYLVSSSRTLRWPSVNSSPIAGSTNTTAAPNTTSTAVRVPLAPAPSAILSFSGSR
jgi:RNA polymerase sigma factor (sigma-70 family)